MYMWFRIYRDICIRMHTCTPTDTRAYTDVHANTPIHVHTYRQAQTYIPEYARPHKSMFVFIEKYK